MSFEWISARSSNTAYVTVDKQQRLYLSADAAKLIDIRSWPEKLFVGYDKANKRMVIGKATIVKVPDVEPFKFDARRYAYAKPFVKDLALSASDLPLRYEYVGDDLTGIDIPKGTRLFQLADTIAEDDAR
jgi:hypothetical protein